MSRIKFGQYHGQNIREIDIRYLFQYLWAWYLDWGRLLSVWNDHKNSGKECKDSIRNFLNSDEPTEAESFLLQNHLDIVWAARKEFMRRN